MKPTTRSCAIPCALLCLGVLGCQTSYTRISQLYGGPDAMAVLAKPDKVEAWRTRLDFAEKEDEAPSGRLHGYVISRGPVAVGSAIAGEMAAILQEDIYEWDIAKACDLRPGVAVRFTRGSDDVLVFFCFECDILLTYFNGRRVGSEDFDSAHSALASLAKKIFPNDSEIRDL